MYRMRLLLLPVFLFCSQVYAHPGFRQITLKAPESRTLNVAVWYPTVSTQAAETIGDNPAFVGLPVIRNAPPTPGTHPLIVLSHGYKGSWRNLSWIATAMVKQGYIVAAPDHPGTTTFEQNPVEAKKLWLRPGDLSHVIDALIAQPELAGRADIGRIAAVGHSLGGWTVMALAGARFDPVRFQYDCQLHALLAGCMLRQTLGIDMSSSQLSLSGSYRDERIKAVVSLDLGLARGFTPESLAAINIPVLILAAQVDGDDVPAQQESGYLAAGLPPRWVKFERVKGATHFSFMQLCKPGAEALLNEDVPGDGVLCHDGEGAYRAEIHKGLSRKISAFLNSSLDYHVPVGEMP